MLKGISALDLKLGLRMLVKYPWLTVVGGLGMAVAVAIGASFFGIIYSMMDPKLPLPQGDRIVSIQNWDIGAEDRPERRLLYDFFEWRNETKTVRDLGAFRMLSRNIIAPYGDLEVIPVTEMTASGFRVAQVAPLVGRYFKDSDERKDAPLVAVIGFDIWRDRYARDPRILQQTVQLGSYTYQIVGVMPEGYGWPLNGHAWIPMRAQQSDYAQRKGPVAYVFGRLAPGISINQAQAEFARIGKRMASEFKETHAQLEPRVLPYTYPFFDIDDKQTIYAFHLLQVSITLLLVLVCANVATLVYARTATRQGEIAVRTALGASRWRIVSQLFAEAFVLATFASVVGIIIAKWALRQCQIFFAEQYPTEMPFWMNIDVSPGVAMYVVGVTFLAAMIVGAVPAMRATGRQVQSQLRQLSGASGLRMGRTWTFLIVAQVAFAVAILPATIYYAWEFGRYGLAGPGFPSTHYLSAQIGMETRTPSSAEAPSYYREHGARYAERQAQLVERLRSEPAVSAVTFALSIPGEEATAMIEVDGMPLPNDSVNYSLGGGTRRGYGVRPNRVAVDFFAAFDVPLHAGRSFNAADVDSASTAVIVNQFFVKNVLRGGDALNRRFRFVGRGGDTDSINVPLARWYTIVGVVGNFPPQELDPGSFSARVYHPPIPGEIYTVHFIRMRRAASEAFGKRLRELTVAVDPTLQVRQVSTLDRQMRSQQRMMKLGSVALTTLTLSVLLLSAAGIYALMSLTVNQRRREIGIRSALGAYPRSIVVSVFKRAARQLTAGIVLGVVAAFVLDKLMWGEMMMGEQPLLLTLVSAIMLTVGMLAAWGPARRGLSIQPTEALRDS